MTKKIPKSRKTTPTKKTVTSKNYHRKYSIKLIEKARQMHAEGHKIPTIQKRLGFSTPGVLRYHLFPESRRRLKERVTRWKEKHPEKAKELHQRASKAWLERNHEKSKESRRRAVIAWNKRNPEKVQELQR